MVRKLDFDRDVRPVVRKRARLKFSRDPEKVNDAISSAWEAWQTAGDHVTAKNLAFYAVLRVKHGLQFRQSARSIDGPNPRRKQKPSRELADVGRMLSRRKDNPAAIATVKMDFAAWLPLLTAREREYLTAFLEGERTQDIAKRMQVTPGAVSLMRRQLYEYWQVFTG